MRAIKRTQCYELVINVGELLIMIDTIKTALPEVPLEYRDVLKNWLDKLCEVRNEC